MNIMMFSGVSAACILASSSLATGGDANGLALLAPCASITTSVAGPDRDIERTKSQIVARLLGDEPEVDSRVAESEISKSNPAESIRALLANLKPDGSWADIDYADQTRGDWKAAHHTKRLLEMARIYSQPGTPLYRDTALGGAIHLALGNWLLKKYKNPNWWYQDIGTPRALAPVLLLMEKELSPKEKEAGLKIVGRCPIGSTGQNRVWIASNHLVCELLRGAPEAV